MPKWILIIIAALTISGAFAACSRGDRTPASQPEKTVIAISATTDSVLAQVAQKKGYFWEEGVEVMPRLHPYGKRALQDVLEGKADFATVAETPVMFAIMDGAKIAIIATIQSSRRGNTIIARKDRGVLTLKDLRGKKIAMTRGTTSDYFLDAMLAVNGVTRDEIRIVDMEAGKMTAALANGDIDAVSTFITYAIPAQKGLGERGITFQDDNVYRTTFNIVATQEFIRENSGKVRKVLSALVRAEEFVRRNPDEAQQVVAGFSGVDIAVARDVWNTTDFHVVLDQVLILALEDESGWAIKNRLTNGARLPNYLDYIYLDGLKAVKPDAVRITR